MRGWTKITLGFIAVTLLAAGFVTAEKQLPTTCKRCNMMMDPANKKYSVTVSEGMEASAFDDIGCAMLWRDTECAMRMSAFDSNARVYDFQNGEPIVIEKAFFVRGAGISTPMGYDIIAFGKKDEAEKFVREKGKGTALTYNQLCSLRL